MTVKLYDTDAYLAEFTATVREVNEKDGHYEILLDRTAFFPEEGGQSADGGTLDDAEVQNVRLVGDEILHIMGAPLPIGKCVTGKLFFSARYDKMQQHTAEHILSGLFCSQYGYHNVGFHLGETDTTLDLDGLPTREMLDTVETLANEAIMKNLPVTAEYPSPERLAELTYRSKLSLTEGVRIVTVEGVDTCACCAPHVARTGEIGCVKILDAERYKGGVRLHMKAGMRALSDYRMRYTETAEISALLSEKQAELTPAVQKLVTEHAELLRAYRELRLSQMREAGERAEACEGDLVRFFDGASYDELRAFANVALPRVGGRLVLLSQGKDTYSYLIAAKERDLSSEIRAINVALGGRGGGRGNMVMGTFSASKEDILAYFEP